MVVAKKDEQHECLTRRRSNVLLRRSYPPRTLVPRVEQTKTSRGDNDETPSKTKHDDDDVVQDDTNEVLSSSVEERPSWISALRSAWDEEILYNMSAEKQKYFLQFGPEQEDDDDDGPKRNRRIRNHMKAFIENEQARSEQHDKNYFFAPASKEDIISVEALHTPDSTKVTTDDSIIDSPTVSQKIISDNKQTQKRGLFQRLFSHNVTNSTNMPTNLNQWISELQKYDQRLQSFIKESQAAARELNNKEQVERLFVYKELCYLKECRLYSVIQSFRKYYIMKVLELSKRRLLEKAYKRVLKKRLVETQKALAMLVDEKKRNAKSDDWKQLLPIYLTDSYYFLSADLIISGNPELLRRSMGIKRLEGFQRELEKEYQNARRIHSANRNMRPKKDQQAEIRRIVEQFEIPNCDSFDKPTHWKDLLDVLANSTRDQLQFEFNCLVGDVRSAEGQSIKTFTNQLKSIGFERVPATEIVEYSLSFVSYVSKLNSLMSGRNAERDEIITKRLAYLVHGFIFGDVIAKELTLLEQSSHELDNDLFCRQQRIVKNLTPTQLGVANKFLPLPQSALVTDELIQKQREIQSEMPYENPIEILSFLSFCTTPNDMLNCVHMCARQIHHIAKRQCDLRGKDFTFGADEFFPVLVYVVSHSNLPFIHTNLAFMSKYMSNADRDEKPDLIYYLTCLEGAVMYIQQLTEEDIRNLTQDDDISKPQEDEQVASSQSPH